MYSQDSTQIKQRRAPIMRAVVGQHAEDSASLHSIRSTLISACHVRLSHIRRFDDRLAAHLEGLAIAGEQGWPMLDAALAKPTPGALFAAAVGAIESRSAERLNRLYALAEAMPDLQRGLISAFGWVEQTQLRGIVTGLLASPNSFLRLLGISACAMHRVYPASTRDMALDSPVSAVSTRVLRAAGELGRRDLLPGCMRMLNDEHLECRFWACWAAVLLGQRGSALEALKLAAVDPSQFRRQAFRLALQAMPVGECRGWLRGIAKNPDNQRWLIRGSGIAGDPAYVPWLIKHMDEDKTARIAGEAFSLITGLDLAYLDLDRKPPEGGVGGPNDDPNDPNVDMDEDDGLPFPNSERISQWWDANGGRFSAGTRYFLGAPLSRESVQFALKNGFQRQRILAAHYLCLLEPGTVLFEWRAPAFRQQRLLAAMS